MTAIQPMVPVLRAQDDSLRGHLGNLHQLLLCEQSAETEEERQICLAGARRRARWALELLDDEARSSVMARQLMKLL